jgi:hypothetical protein
LPRNQQAEQTPRRSDSHMPQPVDAKN